MTAARRRWAADLLHFWFHTLRPADWFRPNPQVDKEVRRRFGRDWAMLRHRPAREFLRDRQTARAAVLLFDQVPRNIHRGSPQALASDRLARAVLRGILRCGWDCGLSPAERQVFALPLMHSETIADQHLSLALYARLGHRFGLPFARSHFRMIARFGRFPHRNAALGRRSTPAELRAVEQGFAW